LEAEGFGYQQQQPHTHLQDSIFPFGQDISATLQYLANELEVAIVDNQDLLQLCNAKKLCL